MALITVAEAEAWLNITDPSESTGLVDQIEAASAAIEQYCSRKFESAAVTETYTGVGSGMIFLRRTPITAVASITVDNVIKTGFTFDYATIKLSNGEKFPEGSVIVVTYTAGYSSVPYDVRLATKITLQAMVNAQAMDPNLMSESLGNVFSGGYGEWGPGALPRAARNLLAPYKSTYFQL